jgi:hypothetical protein
MLLLLLLLIKYCKNAQVILLPEYLIIVCTYQQKG